MSAYKALDNTDNLHRLRIIFICTLLIFPYYLVLYMQNYVIMDGVALDAAALYAYMPANAGHFENPSDRRGT